MIEILRKIFADNPGKSTIEIKKNCSDCGREIIVKITSTAGGYGLQGGVFIQCSPDAYVAACPDCYNANSKMESDNHV
ncbi:MAG: hypothetical protein JRE28_16045 [Deltaproteobacteria bacterium]|nr:hypothetical protein [Deltaproteobacteria bacterium]